MGDFAGTFLFLTTVTTGIRGNRDTIKDIELFNELNILVGFEDGLFPTIIGKRFRLLVISTRFTTGFLQVGARRIFRPDHAGEVKLPLPTGQRHLNAIDHAGFIRRCADHLGLRASRIGCRFTILICLKTVGDLCFNMLLGNTFRHFL